MRQIIISSLLLLSLAVKAQEVPPFAVVTDMQIDGSGCEAGSANAAITSDLNFLSVLYDNFSAELGQGSINPDRKSVEKKCTILVKVQIPAGWNFQFDSVEYRGFVSVPAKYTVAYQLITVEAGGGRGLAFDQHILQGPKTQNYSTVVRNKGGSLGGLIGGLIGSKGKIDASKIQDLIGCSNQVQEAVVKIKAVIGVKNPLAGVSKPLVKVVVDSTDASFRQNLKFKWKRCQ